MDEKVEALSNLIDKIVKKEILLAKILGGIIMKVKRHSYITSSIR